MTTTRARSPLLQRFLDVLACVAVGAAYFALAWLSTHLTPRAGDIAYIWPAGGFVLALLLVAPRRLWLAFAFFPLLGDMVHAQIVSHSLSLSLAYSSVYISVLLGTSAVLRRFAGAPVRLDSIRKLGQFVLIAPIAGNFLAACLGSTISYWSGQSYLDSLRVWWVSDALSMLLITPFLIAWSDFKPTEFRRLTPRGFAEGAVCGIGLVLMSHWAFGSPPQPNGATAPLTHFLIPFLVWSAL